MGANEAGAELTLDLDLWKKFHGECVRNIKTAFKCQCGDEDVCKAALATGTKYGEEKEKDYWHGCVNEIRLTMRIVRKLIKAELEEHWADGLSEASECLSDLIDGLTDVPEREAPADGGGV